MSTIQHRIQGACRVVGADDIISSGSQSRYEAERSFSEAEIVRHVDARWYSASMTEYPDLSSQLLTYLCDHS